MRRERRFPNWALGLSAEADGLDAPAPAEGDPSRPPVLLNGMRTVFSERVPLYPLDLERRPEDPADEAAPSRPGRHP
ncbi:hypothetical protein [Streptomyces sp. NPDC046925]|uniref:hypothetical protein n=1 Tax=Streptomyces sp. NPDC046925 TaxID=3155375 RepID=UPI0033CDC62A